MAGSVISDEVLGSMEFSCKIAGSKLIVVLGHTKCGAIKGACDDVQLGHLTTLLGKIKPAVELENTVRENRTSKNEDFVNKVSQIHVRRSLTQIIECSTVLRAMVEGGEIRLVGGIYDVDNGEVQFFEDNFAPKIQRLGQSA
jgi:carbonic anhydrase